MSPTTGISLVERRLALREKLLTQRQLIGDQLGAGHTDDQSYPRSGTMRFLTRRPALAIAVIAGLATLLGGARFLKPLTAALAVARIVKSTSNAGPRRASVAPASD